MSVLEFPDRLASAHHRDLPPDPASSEVIPFPVPPNGLTPSDLSALGALMEALGDDWLCETQCEPDGDLWAVIGRRRGRSAHHGFVVYRHGTKLILIDLAAELPQARGTA